MSLQKQVHDDMIDAMKSGNQDKRDVLRLVENAIKKKQIEAKNREESLSDEDVLTLISGQIKQRKESISQYEKAGRTDLSEKERIELDILSKYLPEQMNEEDVRQIVEEVIEQVRASSPQDMGKVMGVVMSKVKGRADGGQVRDIVQKTLNA